MTLKLKKWGNSKEANNMNTYENFSYGLRLGLMLAVEIFTEYKSAETN